MIAILSFDGHIRNLSNLDFSIYISFSISAGLVLPANIVTIYSLNFLGRRWSAALSQAFACISMVLCAVLVGKSEYEQECSNSYNDKANVFISRQYYSIHSACNGRQVFLHLCHECWPADHF